MGANVVRGPGEIGSSEVLEVELRDFGLGIRVFWGWWWSLRGRGAGGRGGLRIRLVIRLGRMLLEAEAGCGWCRIGR